MEGDSGMPTGEARVPMGTPSGAGSYKRGGKVRKSGPVRLHKGEMVFRKKPRNRSR